MGEAMKMGDKIALMGKGKLLSYGTPKQLLIEDVNRFVKDFMDKILILICWKDI